MSSNRAIVSALNNNYDDLCLLSTYGRAIKQVPKMRRTILSGVLFWAILICASVFGTFFMLIPLLPLLIIDKRLFRTVADHMVAWYLLLVVSLLEFVVGVKVLVSGDAIRPGLNSLIVMNHRTRLDWMFFYCCLARYSYLNLFQEKISLKYPLKFLPGLGWATQFAAFIFMKRHFNEDKQTLNRMLDYYGRINKKVHILFFPEGTDLHPASILKSDSYAEKECLQKYTYVLHPRTAGLEFIYSKLYQAQNLDTIYDVTVAYHPTITQNEMAILKGRFPQEVHFHVKAHTVPVEGTGIEEWCQNIWRDKEKQLRDFYTEKNEFPARSGSCSARQRLWMLLALVYWIPFCGLAGYAIISSYLVLLYVIVCTSGILYVGQRYDGFDILQAQL